MLYDWPKRISMGMVGFINHYITELPAVKFTIPFCKGSERAEQILRIPILGVSMIETIQRGVTANNTLKIIFSLLKNPILMAEKQNLFLWVCHNPLLNIPSYRKSLS